MLHKIPSLFPWKHNKTKIMAEPVLEEDVNLDDQLAPCEICGRTFLPGPLGKHAKVCEKNATKKRKVFNSLKQRVEGTDLAPFHQQTYLKKPDPPNKSPDVKVSLSSWKEKHQQLVTTIREAKVHTQGAPNRQRSMSIMSAGFERCQTCDRQFGPKAYDRHVEWCKERKTRLPHSLGNIQQAKERLEARINYRVPPLSKPKKTVKEKYQSPAKSVAEPMPTVKSTSNLDRRPSVRKSVDKKSDKPEKPESTHKLELPPEVKTKKCEPLKSSGKRIPPLKINTTKVNTLNEGLTVSQLNTPVSAPKNLTNWSEIFIQNQFANEPILKPKLEPNAKLPIKYARSEVTISNREKLKEVKQLKTLTKRNLMPLIKKSGSEIDNKLSEPTMKRSGILISNTGGTNTRKVHNSPLNVKIKLPVLMNQAKNKNNLQLQKIQTKDIKKRVNDEAAEDHEGIVSINSVIINKGSTDKYALLQIDSNISKDDLSGSVLVLTPSAQETFVKCLTGSEMPIGDDEIIVLVPEIISNKNKVLKIEEDAIPFINESESSHMTSIQLSCNEDFGVLRNKSRDSLVSTSSSINLINSKKNKEIETSENLDTNNIVNSENHSYTTQFDSENEDMEENFFGDTSNSVYINETLNDQLDDSKSRIVDTSCSVDLIPQKLVEEQSDGNYDANQNYQVQLPLNVSYEDNMANENTFDSEIPEMDITFSFDKLNEDNIDKVIYDNTSEFGDIESFHGLYNNMHSIALSQARLERQIRSCCSEIILTNNFDCSNFITYSETDLFKFNRLQSMMKNSNNEIYNKDQIWELAAEEFISNLAPSETKIITPIIPSKKVEYLDCYEQDLISFDDCAKEERKEIEELIPERDISDLDALKENREAILDNILVIGEETEIERNSPEILDQNKLVPFNLRSESEQKQLKNPEMDGKNEHGCHSCSEESKPFFTEIYHNCLQDNIRKIKRRKELSFDNFPEVSDQFDLKDIGNPQCNEINIIPEETQSSLKIDLRPSKEANAFLKYREPNVVLGSGDTRNEGELTNSIVAYTPQISLPKIINVIKNSTNVSRSSSASSTDYSPRFITLIDLILNENLSMHRSKDVLKVTREDCRNLIKVDPKDIPKIKKKRAKLPSSKQITPKSSRSGKKSLILPEINNQRAVAEKKCLATVGNITKFPKEDLRKAGSADSREARRDDAYNPFLTAERQLMELLECDDFKSFTPTPSRKNPPVEKSKSKSTNSVKDINAKNLKHKRASVIDPPSDFQDNSSPDIFDEHFELIENFINENLSDDTILDKLDAISLSSHKTHLTDNDNFNAFCDELSIDPRLINEYDNLSIPEDLTIDDSSPAESLPQINNKFYNSEINKLPMLEPIVLPKPEKPVNLNEMDNLIATVANVDRKKHTRTKSTKAASKSHQSMTSCSFGNPTSPHDKKKHLSSLKRSISVLDPVVKPKNLKNKADVQNYFQEQEMKSSPKSNCKATKETESGPGPAAEDLFSIDDEMYEEYKKYEQMYLLEKEEKLKQEKKAHEDDGLISKISGDSAYGRASANTKKTSVSSQNQG